MPDINFTCTNCGAEIEADESIAGSMAQCPNCNISVMIPKQGISPGMKIAGYEVRRRLGSGGMGEVWLANQTAMERLVALKILSPALTSNKEFVIRFLKEVKTAAKLEHPNIVTAFDAGVDGDIYYLAMSYVDGILLDNRLGIDRKIPEKEALQIVKCIADALCYAWNEFKILHRDIKPANIMIDARKIPKLMDMGISKSLSEEKKLTMTGIIVGTPYYMSPEQARADTDIDCRSDIYSLGATLYHLVTGEVPYDATTAMGILTKHITDPFPPPQNKNPEVSDGCSVLLETMMAKIPEERPETWEAVIRDIALVLSGKFPATKRPDIGKSAILQKITSQKIKRGNEPQQSQKTELLKKEGKEINEQSQQESPVQGKRLSTPLIAVGIIASIVIISAIAFLSVGEKARKPHLEGASRPVEPAKNAITDITTGAPEKVQAPATSATIKTPEQLNEALKAVNPEYKGDAKIEVDPARQIVSVSIDQRSLIKNITPLKGLALKKLDIGNSSLQDSVALVGMQLNLFSLNNNNAKHIDINSLKGMPVEYLTIKNSGLTDNDMLILKGMRLKNLDLRLNPNLTRLEFIRDIDLEMAYLALDLSAVSDLSPLKGRRISGFSIGSSKVSDLSPISGMPLKSLIFPNTRISDLSPLSGMKLQVLQINGTDVSDISVVRGMPLIQLFTHDCKNLMDIKVLSELKDLKTLSIPSHIKDIEFLRSLPKLEFLDTAVIDKVSFRTAKQFWADYDAAKSGSPLATASSTPITTPEQLNAALKAVNPEYKGDAKIEVDQKSGQIVSVIIDSKTIIKDITPLRGLPLKRLDIRISFISDLSPLDGMKLNFLRINNNGQHFNVSRLKDMPLESLNIQFSGLSDSDMSLLKGIQPKNLYIGVNPNITSLDFIKDIGHQMFDLNVSRTGISDLSALKNRNLLSLSITETKVSDLSPLLGMPLTSLSCFNNKITDLSPLKGMKLKELYIQGTDVSDISVLRGMPLTILFSHNCKNLMDIKVLSELKDLKTLTIPAQINDIEFLRSMPKMEFIDAPIISPSIGKTDLRTAKQFWTDYDAAKSGK